MKRYLLLAALIFPIILFSQTPVQRVQGRIVDRDNQKPLSGVSITVMEGSQGQAALSDSLGQFILDGVPAGRVRLLFTMVGYQEQSTDYLLINSAKELFLAIEMEEERKVQDGVTVRATRNPKTPVNKFALVSGRSFTAEETQRYAASANDPGRMAVAFPGVQATRDTRSDIIIRGNNPVGMQWRLEGVDMVNPNHFARKGSSGGGITIFSLAMLDNSDFLTGAMPGEYGDVLSGVFDMHFRKGNNQETEYTFKAGMIGLDFATEGPIKKGQSSYLVNYRYSTLGLLEALGIHLVDERESNRFQDLSFNLAFSNKKNSVNWNVWGIGGYSKEVYSEVEDTSNWKQYDDYAVYDFRTKMGATGIGNTVRLSEKSFLRSSLVYMTQRLSFLDDTLNRQRIPYTINDERYDNSRLSLASSFNHKFSATASMKTGFYASMIDYSFLRDRYDFSAKVYENIINGSGSTTLLQPYWQMSLKPGTNLTINPGVHMMNLTLNKKTTIDPRISVQYRIDSRKNFTLAYGLHSKILPLGSYFFRAPGSSVYPNKDLDMMRAHHYIAAYDQLLGKGWRVHLEGYYQQLFNIPVVDDPSRTFYILDELDVYASEPLVSKGKGKNKGIDLSVEKFFSRGLFMIASFSVLETTYQPLNGKTYNTRFNSGTAGSWTGAKEWKWKKSKMFQAGWKMVYNGGFFLSPLAGISSSREPVLDEVNPYSEKVPAYFRTDARFALRKDKAKRAWQLALDIQNVFGLSNTDGLSRRYDPGTNQWLLKTQSELVPVLSYQIDF